MTYLACVAGVTRFDIPFHAVIVLEIVEIEVALFFVGNLTPICAFFGPRFMEIRVTIVIVGKFFIEAFA